jgi:hypothetical protein
MSVMKRPARPGSAERRPGGTNREQIFGLIQGHPEGLDDDDISTLSGIGPRQQIQQICTELALASRIRRESVSKAGKRRKIHNFPFDGGPGAIGGMGGTGESWRRRLANLVAVTGRAEPDLLDEALRALAVRVLADASSSPARE